MRTDRSNFRAFTLIELLIVLAIIAIMVAMVAPNLRDFAAGRAGPNFAQQIVALTHYAQSQAVSDGSPYRLNFDAQGVWLTMQSEGQWVPPPNDFGQKVLLPDGIRLDTDIQKQPDGQYVTFTPTGRTEQAKITLTDQLGRNFVVSCASPTELFRIVSNSEAQ